MHTEFRRANLPDELRALTAFDRKVFPKADWFAAEDWKRYESWWLIVNGAKAGCCAFEPNADFQEDQGKSNPFLKDSLYISSTGILPRFQGFGLGALFKAWQVAYARRHRFTRIVTNTRKSNVAMIRLNQKFRFRLVRISPGYYRHPPEPTVVMVLDLPRS